jgi:hypothetical protein
MAPVSARGRGDAEHGHALVVLRGMRDVSWRGGWFLAVVPLCVWETSLRLERSPSVLLQSRQMSPPPVLRHLGERWLKLPFLLDAMKYSLVESSIVARYG